jgi:hypothetical protein
VWPSKKNILYTSITKNRPLTYLPLKPRKGSLVLRAIFFKSNKFKLLRNLYCKSSPLVKFRDGTLVKENNNYYIISDGKKLKFSSGESLTGKGYKLGNAIKAALENYTEGLDLQ